MKELQGLSLKNVQASVLDGKKQLYSDFGEMLFTHFGVSGPLMLSASSFAADKIKKNNLKLIIDLKPALSEEQLDLRIVREFEIYKNKQFKNAVVPLFPSKLIPVMIGLSGIHPDKKVVFTCNNCKEQPDGPQCIKWCPEEALTFATASQLAQKFRISAGRAAPSW